LVDAGASPFFRDLSVKDKSRATLDIMRDAPGLRRLMKATDPYSQFERDVEKKKTQENDRTYSQRLKLDKMAEKYYDDKSPANKQDMMAFIKSQPAIDRKRLMERVQFAGQVHNLRDRKWWMSIMSAGPEVRARIYWSRYSTANDTEKKRLNAQMKKLPKIRSARFQRELRKLKTGG